MGTAERDPARVSKTRGSTRTRANRTRCQTPSLLRGLIFGSDGRAMSPMVLDMLASFTAFATQKGKQRIKIIARYQQVDGVNKIIARVIAGQPRKGLLWHFQGSGKSPLMLFAARNPRTPSGVTLRTAWRRASPP